MVRDHVEGLRWLSKALADADGAPPGLRASALRSAGSTIFLTGDYVRAAALAEEALELFRALGDKREVARMLDRLAAAQVNLKRLDAARASAEESLALLEELGDREGALYPLEKLGWIEWENDHRERAVELIEESLAGAREFGDSWWEAAQLDSLAEMALDQGDLARANRLGARASRSRSKSVTASASAIASLCSRRPPQGEATRNGRAALGWPRCSRGGGRPPGLARGSRLAGRGNRLARGSRRRGPVDECRRGLGLRSRGLTLRASRVPAVAPARGCYRSEVGRGS